jgi:predicted metal-binding membrane protein
MSTERTFAGSSALLFAGAAAGTIVWCESMSGMGGMPMPGGWTMSMAWMRMAGQTWPAFAASFLGMWMVMMVAMMFPSLLPVLWRYHRAVGGITLMGIGYFFVWALIGIGALVLGVTLTTLEMRHPALARLVPLAVGGCVLVAGALQFTAWKARQLACCREAGSCITPAWRQGVSSGLQCARCCGSLMAILLVTGVMDLRAMALVTIAITAERLLPAGVRVARAIGVVTVGAGLFLIGRALHG